jgi:diphosphomevalonate decarboxylase
MKQYVQARAPINIALIKYWGKKDIEEVLPFNDSVSLSLSIYETVTTIAARNDDLVTFTLNGQENELFKERVIKFLMHFTKNVKGIDIISHNTGPTKAGLASSASAFAALGVAANAFYETQYDLKQLASIVRKGSGSAVRSLLGNAVRWHEDGSISEVKFPFHDVKMGFFIISNQEKKIGSTEAMKHSVLTSSLYESWIQSSSVDLNAFLNALEDHQFKKMGEVIERNARLMHEVCETSNPPIDYLNDTSRKYIKAIKEAREKGLFLAYVTMDAGPNVKVILRKRDEACFTKWALSKGLSEPFFSDIDERGAYVIQSR